MLKAFRAWRRERILGRSTLDERLWRAVLDRHSFMRSLADGERARLHDLAVLFLHEKSVVGASGLEMSDEIRVTIAAQACMLVLNLDLDWYRGWTDIIVYPDEFLAEYDYVDEDGVAHHVQEPMSGESWLTGPVILSWADTEQTGDGSGYNVVIHEFAHKLDMLNGDANGFPPLHADMSRAGWSGAFDVAYRHFCDRVERQRETAVDPYAAESPAEFFAVLSEAFFEIPEAVRGEYPDVYRQLAAFYRQDPAARLESTASPAGRA